MPEALTVERAGELFEVYRQLGEVLKHLHAIPASGYGYFNGEIRDPLPDNSAHMARVFERYLREFRENAADPALTDKLAAHVADHTSVFTEFSGPPTATVTCTNSTSWQSSPRTAPAR